MEIRLNRLQLELLSWQKHNFPNREPWEPLIGISEEVGELHHAFLKRHQGIRGTREEWDAEIKDALADIIVYLCDFANAEEIDLEHELAETWARVKRRDWQANPLDANKEVQFFEELHTAYTEHCLKETDKP